MAPDMGQHLTRSDEGKRVVGPDGNKLGIIEAVDDRVAYVNPPPNLLGRVKTKLGWDDGYRQSYPLDTHKIETVTDEAVRLHESPDVETE